MDEQRMTYDQFKEAVYRELFTYSWAQEDPEKAKKEFEDGEYGIKIDYQHYLVDGYEGHIRGRAYMIALLL